MIISAQWMLEHCDINQRVSKCVGRTRMAFCCAGLESQRVDVVGFLCKMLQKVPSCGEETCLYLADRTIVWNVGVWFNGCIVVVRFCN